MNLPTLSDLMNPGPGRLVARYLVSKTDNAVDVVVHHDGGMYFIDTVASDKPGVIHRAALEATDDTDLLDKWTAAMTAAGWQILSATHYRS